MSRSYLKNCSLCIHFSNTFNEFREWHCNLHSSQVSITFPHEQICEDFKSAITCESCKYYTKEDYCLAIPLDYNYHGKPSDWLIVHQYFGCRLWESK